MRKLANTNWGSDPNTLRISALALILTLQLLNTVPQSENSQITKCSNENYKIYACTMAIGSPC